MRKGEKIWWVVKLLANATVIEIMAILLSFWMSESEIERKKKERENRTDEKARKKTCKKWWVNVRTTFGGVTWTEQQSEK